MILLERFGLEMKKGYKETTLQVLLSPGMLLISDGVRRPNKDAHVGQGHLMLSGFQVGIPLKPLTEPKDFANSAVLFSVFRFEGTRCSVTKVDP